jgi:uncharacterized protein DUF6526
MAEKVAQTYANHARFHPPFHFFLAPASLIVPILGIVNIVRHYDTLEAWIILLLCLMAPVAVTLLRLNALKVQDRVIRLEERLRLASLLNEPLRSRIPELSESQLIALRFACDEELPVLVEKVLAGGIPSRAIKKSIVRWRPDTFRV